ncbi:ATP-binding protein [Ponticaulis sp.]|uniref:ATP-binding protein n=1 Tax=Ponticaulis sp. TaxID=2020902 RepID=UPI0025F075DD|nr:ATP-binding protein [Ponticaulis sp.]|tara:strand:+ start:99025 stop:101595 length:2571 start_codon:yes stop_codon:yes gene_type:complete
MTNAVDAKADMKTTSDLPDDTTEPTSGGLDLFQGLFWLSLMIAVVAACVAIIIPDAVGQTGPVLLIALASGGMVFLVWVLRGAGRRLGLFPARGVTEAAASVKKQPYAWINALDEAVIITEKGGGAVSANAAYLEIMRDVGVSNEAERALTVDRLLGANPGLSAPIYRLSRAANAGEARHEILPAIAFGSENVPVQFEATVSPLEHGRTLWRLRRLAGMSEALGAADARALFIEEAPLGFYVARANGQVTYMNSWLRNFLGLPDQLGDLKVEDILRPESVKIFRRDKKSSQPLWLDMFFRARDGVETQMQTVTTWSSKGVDSVSRSIVLVPSIAKTSAKDRLTAMSSSRPPRDEHDPLFEDAPFGVARLEGDSISSACIIDANRALVEITDGKAFPGGKFSDLFTTQDEGVSLNDLLLSAVDGSVQLQTNSDKKHAVNVFITLDASGRPAMAYAIDTSEESQLKDRLAHSEKMQAVGTLAGGVAHDFNNMLTAVMGYTDNLLARHPVGDPSFDDLQQISELSQRSAELVKMLLAFSRQQTFKREMLNVSNVLNELNYLIRPLLDERVTLKLRHGRDLPMIRADKGQLENAIINLAVNARDAMVEKGGGVLTISTSKATEENAHEKGFQFVQDGDYLCIEIADNGTGMPPEVMENIFEPFFTTKEQGKGTGLGLATVYGIVKQSGGYICPASKVGEGTSFFIYLPALSAEEVEKEQESQEPEQAQGNKAPRDLAGRGLIMLVEDEDGVRNIAVSTLQARGYEVISAADGEEALELIIEHQGEIDLLISDVILPGIDGPNLLKMAREYLGDARVMFISGYSEGDLTKTLDEERSISFLPKPFRMAKLAERVKEELEAA